MKPYLVKTISAIAFSSIILTSCSGGDGSANGQTASDNQSGLIVDESDISIFAENITDMPPMDFSGEFPDRPPMDFSGEFPDRPPMDFSGEFPDTPPMDFSGEFPDSPSTDTSASTGTYVTPKYEISYKNTDLTVEHDKSSEIAISCNGKTVSISGDGAKAENGVVTITKSGVYALSGNLSGRIIVDSADSDPVRLIFNGISVTCDTSAPLYVASADKVIITLADGTENTFKDCAVYTYDDETNQEPSAAIFSKDDLTFNGNGSLTVEAIFNNGIQCKDKLKICGGKITVNSANDGIKGKDCVGIRGGNIIINSKADGIQSTNTDAEDVGFVNISGGTIKINSTLDGIQAENGVYISDGNIVINAGNGSSSTDSKKGIKGVNDITISGGTISVTASDDAIHSDGKINVEGGSITASSGDDGFHAESEINIKNGKVNITRSYEGLEAAKITISGGDVIVKASDDGVNASDGTGGKGGMGGGMSANSNCVFTVSGGNVYVNANGDGLDSNGSIAISGGIVICEGPTNGGNSSIDHNGTISITGGVLFSIGSSGMAGEILSNTTGTTQCTFASATNGTAGTTIAIKDSTGKVLFVFKTTKQYGHLVFSSPELKTGETYKIFTGGEGSGECINGRYTENKYTGGSETATVTQSTTVTGGGMGGMGGMGGGTRPDGGTRPQKPGRW